MEIFHVEGPEDGIKFFQFVQLLQEHLDEQVNTVTVTATKQAAHRHLSAEAFRLGMVADGVLDSNGLLPKNRIGRGLLNELVRTPAHNRSLENVLTRKTSSLTRLTPSTP